MTPEKQKELEKHIETIAKILYEETKPKGLASLAQIEGNSSQGARTQKD